MRLCSANGSSVSLTVEDYQFPGHSGTGDRDWDAKWRVPLGLTTEKLAAPLTE